jgi:hypothetical protein
MPVFHTYCGRTDIDPIYETEVTKCKCGNAVSQATISLANAESSRESDSRLDVDTLQEPQSMHMGSRLERYLYL